MIDHRPAARHFFDVEMGRDSLFEEWSMLCPGRVPSPSVFAAVRNLMEEETILRVIRCLAFEGKLAGYANGHDFVILIGYMVQTEPCR